MKKRARQTERLKRWLKVAVRDARENASLQSPDTFFALDEIKLLIMDRELSE